MPTESVTQFLEHVRAVIRLKHFSRATEDAYLSRIRQFIEFHGRRHPRTLTAEHVRQYLTHLAVTDAVAASTQNVARSALLFLYRDVLETQLPPLGGVAPARRPERLPAVLTRAEVKALLAHLDGQSHLMAALLYGSGLRLMECLRLRVKDVDFDYGQITVRAGKGDKNRRTMLPRALAEPLRGQLDKARTLHTQDQREGVAGVFLPHALDCKYPNAGREWAWQWVFPAATTSARRSCSAPSRPPSARRASPRPPPATPCAPALADPEGSFATHLIEDGYDITPIKPTDRARTLGTRRRAHHHDLHPRPQPGRPRRPQPPRRRPLTHPYPATNPRIPPDATALPFGNNHNR